MFNSLIIILPFWWSSSPQSPMDPTAPPSLESFPMGGNSHLGNAFLHMTPCCQIFGQLEFGLRWCFSHWGCFPHFLGSQKDHRSAKRYPYHSYTIRYPILQHPFEKMVYGLRMVHFPIWPNGFGKRKSCVFWGFFSIHTSTNPGTVWRFAKAKSLGPPRSAHANSLGGRSVGRIHREWFNNQNLRNETYIQNA